MGKDKVEASSRKWEDMDRNILVDIFACLTVMEVVLNVSSVCRSWRAAAKEHCGLLSSLDLTHIRKKPVFIAQLSAWTEAGISEFYRVFSSRTVNHGFGNLTALIVDISAFARDRHLLYAAQRCPNLKELVLPYLPEITEENLAASFKMWPNLESFAISFSTDLPSYNVLQSIAKNCKKLSSLRFRAKFFDKDTAVLMTNCIPNLKILSFWCEQIKQVAILTVLENLKNLEELYIAHKVIQKMEPFGKDGTIIFCYSFLLDDESIAWESRRLQKFHVCQRVYCEECPNQLDEFSVVERI